jgi:hypothetical protein
MWSIPALLMLSSGAHAQSLFGCDNSGQLFVVNTVTGAGAPFCNLPTYPDPGATEIEYNNSDGSAFVQARDGVFSGQMFSLYSCAPTGPLVSTGTLTFNGLEYVGNVLYGTGISNPCAPSQLATIDPVTGAPTVIGPTGQGPIAGLAWDTAAGVMYGVTGCSQPGPSKLVVVNLATGAASVVGSTGRTLGSLEFAPDGLLYAGGTPRMAETPRDQHGAAPPRSWVRRVLRVSPTHLREPAAPGVDQPPLRRQPRVNRVGGTFWPMNA